MNFLSNFSGKERMFLCVTFFFILYNTFPLFEVVVGLHNQIVCIITVVALSLLYPRALTCKPLLWLYVFLGVLFINSLFGRYIHINGLSNRALPAMWRIIIEAAWIMPSLLIMSILYLKSNKSFYKIVGYGSLIILLASFILILPLLTSYSNILRNAEDQLESMEIPQGLPSYTLMNSYAMLIPGLCFYIKTRVGKQRALAIIVTILVFYVITQTAVSTSIFLSLIIFCVAFVYDYKNKSKTIALSLIIGFLFLYIYKYDLILDFINWVRPFFEGTAVEFKLNDLYDSISGGSVTGGSLTVRADYHETSLQGFYNNPLIGSGIVGGHSQILDIMGTVGLLGIIPFIAIVYMTLRRYLVQVNGNDGKFFVYLVFLVAFVFLYHKGIFGATGWLFLCVIGPCIVLAIDKRAPQKV